MNKSFILIIALLACLLLLVRAGGNGNGNGNRNGNGNGNGRGNGKGDNNSNDDDDDVEEDTERNNFRTCDNNRDCNANQYCFKDDCDDKRGRCRRTPQACTLNYNPVCGCNGKTFSNPCQAHAGRVNVDFKGTCEKECTCSSECRKNEYCAKESRLCNSKGLCNKKPQVCTLEFAPVCGCDGVTYSSTCFAATNGTTVAYVGGCVDLTTRCPPKPEDCRNNRDCDADEFCKKDVGECNQWFARGRCEKVSQVCTKIYMPVCGCDSQTYSNACQANAAKVNVAYAGECRLLRP